MTDLVIISDDGPVRTVRMNRPEKKNALTMAMYDAMAGGIESVTQNPALRCLLIAGAPTAFCAGNDIGDFLAMAMGSGALGTPTSRCQPEARTPTTPRFTGRRSPQSRQYSWLGCASEPQRGHCSTGGGSSRGATGRGRCASGPRGSAAWIIVSRCTNRACAT